MKTNTKEKGYEQGIFETQKFSYRQEKYYRGLNVIKSLDYTIEDLIHYFPCFAGHMTLSRYLMLYECYKQTLGVAGHIAEVGIYKGATLLLLAKLTQIFESESLTQVHGFDWFKGMEPDEETRKVAKHSYAESHERLMKLIRAQSLDNVVRVHKMDVRTELERFLREYPHLQFKLIFLDAGIYEIVKACINSLWDRLTVGGYLILDQFNHELSPGETRAVRELIPDKPLRSFPWCWMPTAYVVK